MGFSYKAKFLGRSRGVPGPYLVGKVLSSEGCTSFELTPSRYGSIKSVVKGAVMFKFLVGVVAMVGAGVGAVETYRKSEKFRDWYHATLAERFDAFRVDVGEVVFPPVEVKAPEIEVKEAEIVG